MNWWTDLGAMSRFLPGTPALAQDMTLNGSQDDFRFTLAYALQNTSSPIDVYPSDTQSLEG